MASTINASTSPAAIVQTADGTANLSLQSNGTTIAALTSTGMAVTGTVSSTGNVGIGTASPAAPLDVQATNGANSFYLTSTTGTNPVYSRYSNTGGYLYMGRDGSAGTDFGAGAYASALWSTGAYPMVFGTNGSERMRIDSSGSCFWNGTSIIENTKYNFYFTSSTNGIGSKTDTASTSYHVRWHNTNGVVGGVYTNGSNTTYTTSSDYRLKENIAPMTGALEKVLLLKPVTYTWKSDGSNGQGFIAHELQAIVPECVGGEKDAVNEDGSINPQGVDTSFLAATLTAAIQELAKASSEQQTIINDLKARVTALEAK
jgi:hypothetical protein